MCDCEDYINVVDLPQLKIYLIMAQYKSLKQTGTVYSGNHKIKYATATQDELAFIYEELGLTQHIEKITNSENNESEEKESGSKKTTKKPSRRSKKD
jgi:hypothetical protein